MKKIILYVWCFFENILTICLKTIPFHKRNQGSGRQDVISSRKKFLYCRQIKHKKILWLHGASIGEIKCLCPIANHFIKNNICDTILLSYTSPDGLGEIKKRMANQAQNIITLPIYEIRYKHIADLIIDNSLLLTVVAEKDIQGRIIKISKKFKSPLMIIDGQLKSKKPHSSLQKCLAYFLNLQRRLIYNIIAQNIDAYCVSNKYDMSIAKNYIPIEKLYLTGPSKAIECASRQDLRQNIRDHYYKTLNIKGKYPIIIAGSFDRAECSWLIRNAQGLLTQYPNALIILAPRHTRKNKTIMAYIIKKIIETQLQWDSLESINNKNSSLSSGCNLLLVDKMGELANIYSLGDVAIAGGSFHKGKGHNILEPLSMGIPTICGHNTKNWTGLIKAHLNNDLLLRCDFVNLLTTIDTALSPNHSCENLENRRMQLIKELSTEASQNISIAQSIAKTQNS